MYRTRIRLDTMTDIQNFVAVVSKIPEKIDLIDDENHCVNAKSLLGVMYSMEFAKIWCRCEKDISNQLVPFMVNNSDK